MTTGGGDDGRSTLFSGERFFKDSAVFEVLGDIDELNSWCGLLRRKEAMHRHVLTLSAIQDGLGKVLAVIATSPSSEQFSQIRPISERDAAWLEREQEMLKKEVDIPPRFITPGELDGIPEIDITRAVARRCERRIVHVIRELRRPDREIQLCQVFLNRLSDYLFVLARAVEVQMKQ